ncbi:CCAAT/enhancer-binding protein gamma [Pristis pectinata]|uniref:CCAAT/enhancer-binding protein gamma n=1 Tax=Pristis pectinata TaxID=685728 RepID=UPI00223DCFF0|nr:CCAAT/enhancer-binding protein gamma [Pristis pectinata]XP_051884083.1 CCAAT/enhancer-binding protein gamma [Pristis pectinata]XP_051884084.1 CCAAT/enhancer-binding protein gamma [Pristis pectinata]XP_051884085.1 CCAAT/enhancer-binding protein gamma [Pristis pectinata]XP_051884086.1 CCAAT/enhancer-binding protein gamma [Pristis pectinata]
MSTQSVISTYTQESAGQNGVSGASLQNTSTGGGGISAHQVPQLNPLNPTGGGKAMAPSKQSKKNAGHNKESEEYRQRRERNNLAVRKSRLKSKQKARDTQQRVDELKEENERLEAKIKLLTKELSVLKDLFLEHAHSFSDNGHPSFTEGTGSGQEASNGGQ